MSSNPSGLPSLRVNRKTILRLAFWVIVLMYLAHKTTFVGNIVNRIYAFPELRLQVLAPLDDIEIQYEWRIERVVAIVNRGNAAANDVYIHLLVPRGRVTRYEIISEEPYQIREAALDEGTLDLWLNRLGPSAEITTRLWGVRYDDTTESAINASAVWSNGFAEPYDKATTKETIESIFNFFPKRISQGWRQIFADEKWLALLNTTGVRSQLGRVLVANGFNDTVVFLFILIAFCWLFFEQQWGMLIVSGIIGVFAMLFLDFWIEQTVVSGVLEAFMIIEATYALMVKQEPARVIVLSVAFVVLLAGSLHMVELPAGVAIWCIATELCFWVWPIDLPVNII